MALRANQRLFILFNMRIACGGRAKPLPSNSCRPSTSVFASRHNSLPFVRFIRDDSKTKRRERLMMTFKADNYTRTTVAR